MIAEHRSETRPPRLDGQPTSTPPPSLEKAPYSPGRIGSKVHILFLIDELCEPGGAERVLLNMIRRMPQDRFRCSLATFDLDPNIAIFRDLPCPAYVFPIQRTYGASGFRAALKLRKLIRSQHVEILHTFHETSDTWGSLVAKWSGCPVLVSSRRDMGILRSAKHRMAYRLLSPMFDQVLTVSEEVRRFCIQQDNLHPSKVLTLYNGIDLERVAAARCPDDLRQRLGLAQASHLIVTVGHVRRVKGFDTFIQAAEIVRREFPRAVFLVVGDVSEPEHYRELQALIEQQGCAENVRFLGPSEDVFGFLKMSDVFCLLSRSEGFSNALLEAMACELPCVATRVSGTVEAIEDGVSGFLVATEDAESAADRILRLLRQPEEAKRMGQAGRKTVEEKFTVEGMMDKLTAVYDSLVRMAKVGEGRLQAEIDAAAPRLSQCK